MCLQTIKNCFKSLNDDGSEHKNILGSRRKMSLKQMQFVDVIEEQKVEQKKKKMFTEGIHDGADDIQQRMLMMSKGNTVDIIEQGFDYSASQ